MAVSGATHESEWLARVPNPAQLAAASRAVADTVYHSVADQYLVFRHLYYYEAEPSLATVPPRLEASQQAEAGKLAAGTLRLMPKEVRGVPIVRDLVEQLQWVVDIHTLTERERTELHNITMVFLYGVTDGIQAWYVEWLLAIAHALAHVTHPNYYLVYPWQGLLYRSPADLTAFTEAVRNGDVEGIEGIISHLAEGLVAVLRDPITTQTRLAFSGPDGERRQMLFNLKTTAALALGAYITAESVRSLLGQGQPTQPPQSVITAFPAEINAHVLPEDTAR